MASGLHTARSRRDTSAHFVSKATDDAVAPGTYANTHNVPGKVPELGHAPFSSLAPRAFDQRLGAVELAAPGPGSYVSQQGLLAARKDGTDGPLVATMRSACPRMGPTAPGSSAFCPSSMAENPGPGTYTESKEWTLGMRKVLRAPAKPVLEPKERTNPTMPSKKRAPGQPSRGYEDDIPIRHVGEGDDKVGPGEYDPEHSFTQTISRHAAFGASTLDRGLWEASVAKGAKHDKSMPGPGAYQHSPGVGGAVGDAAAEGDAGPRNTFQFQSGARMAHQVEVDPDKTTPGPGQYSPVGYFTAEVERVSEQGMILGERSRFGSNAERTGWIRHPGQPFQDPYHVHNVPGPGAYADVSAFLPSPRKKSAASRALPPSKETKHHGVHHPSLLARLSNERPAHAFNVTDDRDCNKAPVHGTPAPSDYRREDAQGQSMASKLEEKAKVGRMGAFGTRAHRFHGGPLEGRSASLELSGGGGGGAFDALRTDHSPVRHAVFLSRTPREAAERSPLEPRPDPAKATPAPGHYNIEHEVDYRSKIRVPELDHLAFGSSRNRFPETQDTLSGRLPDVDPPGPTTYNALIRRDHVRGCAEVRAKRASLAGAATTEPHLGPGCYGGALESTLAKKSHNALSAPPLRSLASAR